MIRLPDRRPFNLSAASGALGLDGLGYWWERPFLWLGLLDPRDFVIIAKTVTAHPRAGNLRPWRPWTCVRPLAGGNTVNAVGLTNPGLERWLLESVPRARRAGLRLAASVRPRDAEEAAAMGGRLAADAPDLEFVEANLSCPNAREPWTQADRAAEILRRLGEASGLPVVLKLRADQVRDDFVKRVDPVVDAYDAINAVPWADVFGARRSPLAAQRHGQAGAVSGPAIAAVAREAVRSLRRLTGRPILGGGGVMTADDARMLRACGADAVALGTCFLHRPWRPSRIAVDLREFGALPIRVI